MRSARKSGINCIGKQEFAALDIAELKSSSEVRRIRNPTTNTISVKDYGAHFEHSTDTMFAEHHQLLRV